MFELHFDGAHFGPPFGETGEDDGETADSAPIEATVGAAPGSSARKVLAVLGTMAFFSIVGRLAARRFRCGDGGERSVRRRRVTPP
jgi:hypothetical protein